MDELAKKRLETERMIEAGRAARNATFMSRMAERRQVEQATVADVVEMDEEETYSVKLNEDGEFEAEKVEE